MSSDQVQQGLILMIGLVISVGCHEFGHAWVAHLLGDPTPESQGRVTLNPMAHADPIGTLLIPAILIFTNTGMIFGWGKPVEINPLYFKRKISMAKGDILVSLAGPMVNILLALVFTLFLAIMYRTMSFKNPSNIKMMYAMMTYIHLNIILFAFNLLPIPPLDGSHILMNTLGPKHQGLKDFLSQYGFFILIGLMIVPGALAFIFTPANYATQFLINLARGV
jgi:Zn-dependent protease